VVIFQLVTEVYFLSYRPLKRTFVFGFLVWFLLLTASLVTPVFAGINGDLEITRVQTQQPETLNAEFGIDWESGRQLTGLSATEYDNLRLTPLNINYGLTNYIQLGSRLSYSSNTGNSVNNPGLESFLLTSKYKWNRNFATEVNVGVGLTEDVFPYGGDGTKYGVNIPWQVAMGPGNLIGEIGFSTTDGKISDTTTWSGYANYGIGYAYELTRTVAFRTEIAGHGATIERMGGSSAKDHLALIMTPAIELNLRSTIRPSLKVGLADGSPDVALGFKFSMTFGQIADRRIRLREGVEQAYPLVETPERYSDDTDTTPDSQEDQGQLLVLPGEQTSDTYGRDQTVDPEQAQKLAQEARNAFQNGDIPQAIRQFKSALNYDPNNVEILSNLGSLHYRQGNYQKARRYYQRAVEVDPDDQLSRLFLGITYNQLGEIKKARTHLKKAQSIDPNSQTGQKAANWLKRLQAD
jgi:hypothetical protein